MKKKTRGMTLIELMIGLVIGLLILTSAGGMFSATLSANSQLVQQQRFEQTVQVLMFIMSSEIRRAGYTKTGITLTDQSNGSDYFASTNCVLMSHSTSTEDERFFGFKLVNDVVYMYSGIANPSATACTNSVTGWSAVTDTRFIKVTQLWFDTGKVDLTANYDCASPPIVGDGDVTRVTLGVEAISLHTSPPALSFPFRSNFQPRYQ